MTQPITLVNDIEPRSQFDADGVQVAFPCSWPTRTGDDLRILFDDGDTPEIVYSLTGINDDAGFTVTFQTPPPDGTRITVFRSGPLERQTNYGQQRRFSADVVNGEFVDYMLRLQELNARLGRMLRLPDTDPPISTILPPASQRANKFAGFDSDGAVVALASPGSLVLDFNQYPTGTPEGVDTFIFNDDSDTTGSPVRKASLSTLASLLQSLGEQPFRTAADVGLVGNGTTDDSFRLQADMEAQSAAGGCAYWLKSPVTGGSFYLEHSPRVPSNITIIFSSPILLAKEVTFFVRGRRAALSGADSFRLLADITAAGAVAKVDTAPHGGGALSTFFAVDDFFEIVGQLDGCATPVTTQECRVTAVNDGAAELTISSTFSVDYPVTHADGAYTANYGQTNYSVIRKMTVALATADLDEGDNLIAIRAGDVGRISAGDTVIIKDDLRTDEFPGAAGSTSVTCNEELALVVPSAAGDPSASLRLDRRVSRSFTTAKYLRVIKLDAVTNSVISGARALSAEAPDLSADRVHWFEQRFARGCVFDSCSVPNTDVFGKLGTAFNFNRCLNPLGINLETSGAKYIGDGEGNGIVFDRCTGGRIQGGTLDGDRHATQCVGGNGHSFHDVTIINPRHAPIDCHGTNERDCNWYDCTVIGGTRYEVGEGRSPPVITFGNTTFLAGAHRCGFHGGSISGFNTDVASKEPVLYCHVGSRNCVVDTKVSGIRQAFRHSDLAGYGTIVSSGHRIRFYVDGCDDFRVVDVHGRRNGASVDTLVDTRIEIYGRRLNGGIYAVNCTELEISGCDFDEVTIDPSATYFLEAEDCPSLRVLDNTVVGMGRFVRVQGCTDYRIMGNRIIDLTSTTVLRDDGGCSGTWVANVTMGFIPFYTPDGTSTITIDARFPGQFDLPDDSVLKVTPSRLKGLCQFHSVTGTSFSVAGLYDLVTSDLDLGPFTSVNVDASTADLTGTTGVDGRITISAYNTDDELQIENRTGGTIRIDGWVS